MKRKRELCFPCTFPVPAPQPTPPCPPACDIQTRTFANPNPITINDSEDEPTPATPYPSSITVSDMTGKIIKVTVRLINIRHDDPSDIDIMLVGPTGLNAIIMSDVGGTVAITDVTLTLDDQAPTALPDSSPLISGIFKPTNAEDFFDTFPGFPSISGGNMLSSFNFTNPNGTWSLFVVDDLEDREGIIAGGWELTITTSNCTL